MKGLTCYIENTKCCLMNGFTAYMVDVKVNKFEFRPPHGWPSHLNGWLIMITFGVIIPST
eukprot:c16058_g1_i2 orf=1-177(-)